MDHMIPGGLVTAVDPLGEFDLLLDGEQDSLADFLQIHLQFFDAEYQSRPRIEFKDFILDKDEVDSAIKEAVRKEIPDYVLTIKVLSDFKRNKDLNVSQTLPIPENLQAKFNAPQHDPGEECEIPYVFKFNKDLMLEEIEKFKKKLGEENLTSK